MTILENILITGSDGFIGNHLVDFLINKKMDVTALSLHKKKKSKVRTIHKDIRTVSNIPNDISHMVHLAALTDISYCQSNPRDCFETNVMGTLNMLEMARKNESKFIFASSNQIFGAPKKLPISENAQLSSLSIYAASKACGELLCETYSKLYGLDVIVLRLFSIYGPRGPSYYVISKIITQILKNKKIMIGNISPKRDFLYVSDLISAFELLIKMNLKGFLKYNVGYGGSTSINELCHKLIKISKKKIPIESDKKFFRESEIPNLVCDNSKIRRLGWKPKITLDEGLARTFQWFTKKLNQE